MRWSLAYAPEARFIVTAAGDAPLLPRDLARRLLAALAPGKAVIALAQSLGELHPVIGLWPVALADDLEAQLAAGIRKVLHFTRRHGTIAVEFAPVRLCGLDIDPFFNANTPAELEQLRASIARDIP
jgi:molybdopterin-guanine dinucleotide biosynthesis protein A